MNINQMTEGINKIYPQMFVRHTIIMKIKPFTVKLNHKQDEMKSKAFYMAMVRTL
jgi:hypothetical protein